MNSIVLVTALLSVQVAQHNQPSTTTSQQSGILLRLMKTQDSTDANAESLTCDELRTLYKELLQTTTRKKQPSPYKYTETLVALHRAVAGCKRMSHSEKKRLHTSLEGRLKQMQTLLRRDVRRSKETDQKNARAARRRGQPVREFNASFSGPVEIRNAQNLIALIQATIEPDSWDVNGGKGSAMFYSPLNVLVIRNTAEVHHQIGGRRSKAP